MESRAKIFGHPIHPMLIVFPLGLFFTAVISDIIFLVSGINFFAVVSFYDIAGGIIGGLTAAVFGFRDFLSIPGATRARRVAAFHGIGNVILVILFLISWLIRLNAPGFVPPAIGYIVSFVGAGLALITGWLGAEMVYRLDVGVDSGANLNAPSSLSGEAPEAAPMGRMKNIPVTGEEQDRDIDEP